jgi:hypothetical protein
MANIKFEVIADEEVNITTYQGKTISFVYTYGGSSPIDVTGYTAALYVKRSYSDSSLYTSFTTANSRVSVGGANGQITFSMTAADSAALTAPFVGVYQIELTSGSTVTLGMQGKFVVKPEVS